MKNLILILALLSSSILSAQTLTREAVATDLGKMVVAMETYHCNAYRYTDSVAISAFRTELVEGLAQSPSPMEAYRAMNQLACLFGDGHTRVWDYGIEKDYRAKGGTYFPLGVTVQEGQLIIRSDLRGTDEALTRRQITAINGIPTEQLIREMSAHASRETADLDLTLLSGNFRRYLWLTYDWAAGDFELSFTDGEDLTVSGITSEEVVARSQAIAQTPVISVKILEGNVAYLRVKHFEGRPKTFKQRFNEAFKTIKASGADQLILDLRGHGGGDSRVGDELARYFADEPFRQFAYSEWKATPLFKESFKKLYLPRAFHWAIPLIKGINPHTKAIYSAEDNTNARVEHPLVKPYGKNRAFNGEVTLLMDNNTFSAGTCFAAMFKDYAMGSIVGQESGNLANFHADGLMRLPLLDNTLVLQISNSYLVRPNGNEAAVAVQPDVKLEVGTDALEFVLMSR